MKKIYNLKNLLMLIVILALVGVFNLKTVAQETIELVSDTHIQNGKTNNFSANEVFILKSNAAGEIGRLALLQFDLSEFELHQIDSVILVMVLHNSHDGEISVYEYPFEYDPEEVTWDNAPETSLDNLNLSVVLPTLGLWHRDETYHSFDITEGCLSMLDEVGGEFTLALAGDNTDKGYDIHSMETSTDFAPYVLVYLNDEVGISNETISEINKVYPSMVTDMLYMNNAAGVNVEIFNHIGKMVHRGISLSSNYQIDMSSFSAGVYIVQTQSDEMIHNQKVIKK